MFENRVLRDFEKVTEDWRRLSLFTKYYLVDQMKNSEIGGECGTYGRGKKCLQDLDGES